MTDLAAAFQAQLPEDLFLLVGPLLRVPTRPLAELRRQVQAYAQVLEDAHSSRNWPEMDVELGRACSVACNALLDHLGPDPDPDRLRLADIAVRYFVTSGDDEDDLESLVGFDDDALVINASARVLGAEAAVIPLVPR